MALVVYGIPTCGTCKKALQWLDSRAISYKFVDTKGCPPGLDLVTAWVDALGSRAMRNTSGLSYRALGDEKKAWGDPEWTKAFSQDAMLLKRPLFVKNGKAVLVGFRASEAMLMEVLAE